jgi:hypothetical protein
MESFHGHTNELGCTFRYEVLIRDMFKIFDHLLKTNENQSHYHLLRKIFGSSQTKIR